MNSNTPILKDNVNGFILEHHEDGNDFAINQNDQRIELGQMVISNGRCGINAGRCGIVVHIRRPFTHNRTTDIIEVHFEGDHHPSDMKFKDLAL